MISYKIEHAHFSRKKSANSKLRGNKKAEV